MVTGAANKHPREETIGSTRSVRARGDEPEDVPQEEDFAVENPEDDDEEEEESEGEEEDEPIFQLSSSLKRNGGVYTFHSVLTRTYEYEFLVWDVETTLSYKKNGKRDSNESAEKVGSLKGHLLRRGCGIHMAADATCGELQELALMFCERNGAITRVETGIDDNAVYGNVFHIYTVVVDEEHRGKCDLGLHLVHHTLEFLQGLKCGNTTELLQNKAAAAQDSEKQRFYQRLSQCMPTERWGWDIAVMIPNIGQTPLTRLEQHFSRMGFCQAGRNVDQYHAYFLLASKYDAGGSTVHKTEKRWKNKNQGKQVDLFRPPPRHEPTGADIELRDYVSGYAARNGDFPDVMSATHEIITRRGASIHDARALHVAAANPSDDLGVLAALVLLGGDVNGPDENGDQPLHIAAFMQHTKAIKFLLQAGASRTATNAMGETPLDTLKKKVEGLVDFFGIFDIPWWVKDVLERYHATVLLMSPQITSQLIGGWLSPRMRYMLSATAGQEADLIKHDAESFERGRPTPLSSVFAIYFKAITSSEFLPAEVIHRNPDGLYKSFCGGWGVVWSAISTILDCNRVPTLSLVQAVVEKSNRLEQYRHFVEKGGKIEYALDALLALTKNLLETGDAWGYLFLEEDIDPLPSTPFDEDFDLARAKVFGLQPEERITTMGPYEHCFDENGNYKGIGYDSIGTTLLPPSMM